MSLVLFNTLSRQKEPFKSISLGEVKLYTCGPTVYDFPHIGNLRTFVFEDVLRRWLKLSGYKVTQVMNITDIDDKTIRGAITQEKSLSDYTETYIRYFFEDISKLNIEQVEHYPRATEHVPEMVQITESLLAKGIAYRGEDGSIYYNVNKFPNYGKLAHIQVEELKTGARVQHDEYDKEQAADFALWKAWDSLDGEAFWETNLGKGRPGWHIECSAMSMKYLGAHFDIHAGGVDNIFPHHENEIAQSEAYTGETFVNMWLHAEHLLVDGKKMSKSLGNFYTLRDILNKGYSLQALRYFYATSHYRNKLNFTFDALNGAAAAVERIYEFLRRINRVDGTPLETFEQTLREAGQMFTSSMNDDLNTPRAVAALHDLVSALNVQIDQGKISSMQAKGVTQFFLHVDKILGLNLQDILKDNDIPSEILLLLNQRNEARKSKDFKKADEFRQQLYQKGFVVEDTSSGSILKALEHK